MAQICDSSNIDFTTQDLPDDQLRRALKEVLMAGFLAEMLEPCIVCTLIRHYGLEEA
jgi:hypothetical protein